MISFKNSGGSIDALGDCGLIVVVFRPTQAGEQQSRRLNTKRHLVIAREIFEFMGNLYSVPKLSTWIFVRISIVVRPH